MRTAVRRTLAAAWTLLACAGPGRAAAETIALRAGRLVDPEAGSAAPGRVIVVQGGRIASVGTAVPAGARVIDLSAATVLPGLFDCHTHLCASIAMRASPFELTMRDLLGYVSQVPTASRALVGASNARLMLEAGFTSVRDVGNAGLYADTALRQAVEAGLVPGPTIVNAGRIIAPVGGQLRLPPDRPDLGEPEYIDANGPDEIRRAVRQNVHFGARVIKLVVDDQPYVYSVDEIRAAVEEATAAGVRVAAHCITSRGARHAVEAGVASVEHGFGMTDDDLARARQKGVVLVGTDLTREMMDSLGMGSAYPLVLDRLRRARRAGVTIAYGSDAFMELPGRTRAQLALSPVRTMAEAGLSPAEILRSMTVDAARLLGLDGERGRIAPGMAADIIATRASPLEDPRALEQVVFVMKDGRVVLDRTRAAERP